jgi:hypothetical protein
MVDWYVVLAPPATLPIVLLLVFLGCQLIFPIDPNATVIALKISPGCDTAASSITVTFGSFINDETDTTNLTPVPAGGITISTEELPIALDDEGDVWCTVTITPISGDAFNLPKAGKAKLVDQPLDPFTLDCIDGEFELS